jgi:very-short-patch-repair endonuclease
LSSRRTAARRTTSSAWNDDAERDAALSTADFRVLRFTWWDVVHDAARVTAILRPLLAA